MALASNPNENMLVGRGRLYFKPVGEAAYLDLGEVPKFELTPELERLEKYSSRSGSREKILDKVIQKKVTSAFDLEEYSIENLNLAMLGDGVQQSSQSAGSLDGQQVTTVPDRFVDLGKTNLSVLKIAHGNVTGGPFEAGETITGGTSSATAKIAWAGSGFLEVVSVSGAFQAGETITGGTSTASAAISGTETLADVVVTDDPATPTTRYAAGTDYDVDLQGGLLRARSTGSIAANTCHVSASHAAKTYKSVRALANSEARGVLLFIGEPDIGPQYRLVGWNVSLSISGAMGFISESDTAAIAMQAEFLADRSNHPSEPFYRITEIS